MTQSKEINKKYKKESVPMEIEIESGLHLRIHIDDSQHTHLAYCSAVPEPAERREHGSALVQLQFSGQEQDAHHGAQQVATEPGVKLRYQSHEVQEQPEGPCLVLVQEWKGVEVISRIQLYHDTPVLRSSTEVVNHSEEAHTLESLSSFVLHGIDPGKGAQTPAQVAIPHNTWTAEAQWQSLSLQEAGLHGAGFGRIQCKNTGTWSSKEQLPMGAYLPETGEALVWQIESSGSWNWEISEVSRRLYLFLGGANLSENGFLKHLRPGERFSSVPCAVAFAPEFECGIQALTAYRRHIRRPNQDNSKPLPIFNDYMNCLNGSPTEENEVPLIHAAAAAGCAYYCVDCGWYADGSWWTEVGEWLPSEVRFPSGIQTTLQTIRDAGMIPGLWLELEVMGVNCPVASTVPDAWFFLRGEKRVIDHGRYQLDYRNPEVRAYADEVIDRLVDEYGVGYIKMDYNIEAGMGTEYVADSLGDGLEGHRRAYLAWLDGVFARYPALVIENCGSGGCRMDYALLARHSIQSLTDQTDYRKMAAIACNAMTAVAPEQSAIWSYPMRDATQEATVFNMVNALLFRVHQSGHLAEISPECFALVQEGLLLHREIAQHTKTGLPFWPLGLARWEGATHCVGVDCGTHVYLALWNVSDAEQTLELPLQKYLPNNSTCACCYPQNLRTEYSWREGLLTVTLAPKTARLFEVRR